MAEVMTLTRSRASWYWCGDLYNNIVMGNTGTVMVKQGMSLNSAGKRETQSAGIYEFDLSAITENRVITNLKITIPVTSIQVDGETYTKEELGGIPNIIKVWRSTGYDLSAFTEKSHSDLVGMKNPYDGYSLLTDEESPVSFNASSYLGQNFTTEIPAGDIPENKKIYVIVNRDNNYSQAFDIFLGAATLAVTYDVVVPNPPTDLVPNGSIRNKQGAIRLSWTYLDEQLGTLQSKYDVLYSTDNFATSKTISKSTSDTYCDIPANTFSDGQQVKWRVRAYNSFGDPSEYSTIALFTIGATPPDKPIPLKPMSVVNSADAVIFGWKYVDPYQGTQAKYTLQYKKGDAVTEVTGTTDSTRSIAAGTLEGGDYQWRVKTANQYGEYSDWCDWTPFYSIGRPDKPVIVSISTGCRPVVTWTAAEEDAWEMKITKGDVSKYETGVMPAPEKDQYQVPEYLEAGNYVLSMRVRNVYGLWSEETRQAFAVSFTAPAKPYLTATQYKENVIVQITSSTSSNILYRESNGEVETIPLTGKEYTDFTVSGDYRYFVRALTVDGYADSDPATGKLRYSGITLSGKDTPDTYVKLRLTKDEDKRKTATPATDVAIFNCTGRVFPVAQSAGFKSYIENHEYFLEDDAYEAFKRIQDSNALYFVRDGEGGSFYAVMTNPAVKRNNFGRVVSFTLEKVEV